MSSVLGKNNRMLCRVLQGIRYGRHVIPASVATKTTHSCHIHTGRTIGAIKSASVTLRQLSTTTTEVTAPTPNPTPAGGAKPSSNILIDNLGKIFLSAIALIVVSLVRSYNGTQNKNTLRDALEAQAAIDPMEIDDLRIVNGQFTADVYRHVMKHLQQQQQNAITYQEFIQATQDALKIYIEQNKGKEAVMLPTIEFGHLLDRVVLQALKNKVDEAQPLDWWAAVLILVVNASVPDRVRLLYEALNQSSSLSTIDITTTNTDDDFVLVNNSSIDDNSANGKVTITDVRKLVGYLQDLCQLVPETQIIPHEAQKYPAQKYVKGTPSDLVSGNPTDTVDVDAMAEILRSRAVCAWGECYHKKKFG